MSIFLSHGGATMYESSSPTGQVLVGTKEGIVTIEKNGGSGWRVAGRVLEDKFISSIIREPDSGLLFAGAFFGGIHVSADDGKTWEPRVNGLSQTDVYSLASVRMGSKVRIYAGTEPAHIFYTEDLGLSWTELPGFRSVPSVPDWKFPGPPHVAHLKHINFDPFNPSIIYGSIEVGELLRSVDEGKTWQELGVPYKDVHRAMIPTSNPSRIYVTGGMGMYVSSDGGDNWEHWTDRDSDIGGYPDQLVFLPSNPDLMFVSAAHKSPPAWAEQCSAGARISRSSDGGRTWEALHGGLPDRLDPSVEAMCLEEWDGGFSIFAATTGGEVLASEDSGETWSVIVGGLAPVSKKGHYTNVEVPVAA